MAEMASLVLYAANQWTTAAFYRVIGLDLADEDHGEGPPHLATELGPVHFAIYPAEAPGRSLERRVGGSYFPGFYVDSLDRVAATLTGVGALALTEHEKMSWGCRAIIEDPDGRAVEINQRDHCSRE